MTQVHIVAFNANEYRDALAAKYPDFAFTFDLEHRRLSPPIYACEVLIAFGNMLTDEVFRRNKRLRWVQSLGTGLDGLVDRADLGSDVVLTSMRGIHGPQMSEMAFLMMLSLNRDFERVLENQRNRHWHRWPGRILEGKTIGILGVGLIAEALARRCKAFDMRVVGITGTPRQLADFDEIRDRAALAGAVGDLDYLVVLTPHTVANRKLVDGEIIRAMKPGSVFINLARGGVVDDDAVVAALRSGHLAGAGIDVFETEPLPSTSPLWEVENLILTPHMSGMSEAYVRQALAVIEPNFEAYLAGRPDDMINRVDRQED
jgi:phosphoglycerate dehydrogenase-like enzyme